MVAVELVQDATWEIGWMEVDVQKFVRVTRVMYDGVNKYPFSQILTYSGDTPGTSALQAVLDDIQDQIDQFTA